ncbi:MAG: L-seryl-tRNA(Sec) selenium transferase [Pseudomonadales bacterium]
MSNAPRQRIPSVEELLASDCFATLNGSFGRHLVKRALRATLDALREHKTWPQWADASEGYAMRVGERLAGEASSGLRPVHNLTGTVIHTNLGRATLPEEAIAAIVAAARSPVDLEYDLPRGARGDRDRHVEASLCELTGAEAATVVNNNAAAVLLTLNSLALGKEVPVSRGELIEIGGSFRMPDIMARAGCVLREVGTTNRTHLRDYENAIGDDTALLMKVHPSNYSVEGFTKSVSTRELADVTHARGLPLAVDLGSGTLLDLRRFGLPREPTAGETIAQGADLVSFSGDKLLGGPQAGLIVGRRDLIQTLKANPLKRALRVDKLTLAALSEVLKLYGEPDTLAKRLPLLRALTRTPDELRAQAQRLAPLVQSIVGDGFKVGAANCESQIGSGSLPSERLASHGLKIEPTSAKQQTRTLEALASRLRALPTPVLGYIHSNALMLDLRCLDDEQALTHELELLRE